MLRLTKSYLIFFNEASVAEGMVGWDMFSKLVLLDWNTGHCWSTLPLFHRLLLFHKHLQVCTTLHTPHRVADDKVVDASMLPLSWCNENGAVIAVLPAILWLHLHSLSIKKPSDGWARDSGKRYPKVDLLTFTHGYVLHVLLESGLSGWKMYNSILTVTIT